MKRRICVLIAMVLLIGLTDPVSAYGAGFRSWPETSLGRAVLHCRVIKNEEQLVRSENYGYMIFIEDFKSGRVSLSLPETEEKLIHSGSEPDRSQYMEVLSGMLAAGDLESAHSISEQKKPELNTYGKEYDLIASGIYDTLPQTGPFEEEIRAAVNSLAALDDNDEIFEEALNDLETLLWDYFEYDDFLKLAESNAEGELRAASTALRSSMESAFRIRLDSYKELSEKNREDYGECFFSEGFFEKLKQVPAYEKDGDFRLFVDAVNESFSETERPGMDGGPGTSAGTGTGDPGSGSADLAERLPEMTAVYEISAILEERLPAVGSYLAEDFYGREYEASGRYLLYSNDLIWCRLKGEYCLGSILAEDEGLMSWFRERYRDEVSAWYEAAAEKLLKIRDELTKEPEDDGSRLQISEKEAEVYRAVVGKLYQQYGGFRNTQGMITLKESYFALNGATEVNGVCYLRLLDFDQDGHPELYAAAKNEEDERYRGYIYCAEKGTEPILKEYVDSVPMFGSRSLDLVRKGKGQYYVYVRSLTEYGESLETVYGYAPSFSGDAPYTRSSYSKGAFEGDPEGTPEYRIRDDALDGKWTEYDESEFEKKEKEWWSDAELLTSLSLLYDGDRDRLTGSVRNTLQQIHAEGDYEILDDTVHPEITEPDRTHPFYGIWCGAFREREDALRTAAKLSRYGLPAEIYFTSAWTNLIPEDSYIVSAGSYASQKEAEEKLLQVKACIGNAYIRYSGEPKTN